MSAPKLFRVGSLIVLIGFIPIFEGIYQGSVGVRARESLGSKLLSDFPPLFHSWSVYDQGIQWEQSACDSFGYSYLYRLYGRMRVDSIPLRCEGVLSGSGAMRMPVFALKNGDTLSCAQLLGAGTICVNLAGKAVAAKPHDPENALDVIVADAMGFQRGWAFGYGYILCFYVIVAGFIVLMISAWKALANKFRERQTSNSNGVHPK